MSKEAIMEAAKQSIVEADEDMGIRRPLWHGRNFPS